MIFADPPFNIGKPYGGDPGVDFPAPHESTVIVAPCDNLDTWPPSIIAAFHAWLRHQPCAACGSVEQVEVAHFPYSQGAGAADWQVLPLCHAHHIGEQHADGVQTFWAAYRYPILTWYARTLAGLWQGREGR